MIPEELRDVAAKRREHDQRYTHQIHVCTAAGCLSSNSGEVLEALQSEIKERELGEECLAKGVGCMGLCAGGPLVAVRPDDVVYAHVTPEDAPAIVDALGGEPAAGLEVVESEAPFYERQFPIALENCGRTDPEKVQEYVGAEGYAALARCVTELSPNDVVTLISRSGLRGRGGAGYPTGLKWSTVEKARAERKFVVCNADEGDPGAFMDRSILEGDPHRVLEGMTIAAYAVGADQGYIYIRAEYPLAIERLRKAIRQARHMDLLGRDILGSNFSFDIEIRLGAGAFVCGEETALMASIEGKRGTPRPRPPYPANYGLWGYPTLINNVETYANIAPIVRKGAEWFSGIGTEKSKGTKVFALAGSVRNTGLIEVPMGTTLREIIFDIGGGIPDGRKFKAVQTGGPSGGCIPEKYLDVAVDYESLRELGSIMGSGGMIVMDETACMVDVAKYFMEFCRSESCGRCLPCRAGTPQMLGLLDKITRGEATMKDLDLLEELCDLVRNTALCGLGQTAPNPVVSTLRYFRDEYLAHIEDKTCPAGKCKMTSTTEVNA
ncbi:MAG: NADH-quinone oxidoreductase subunit NuoF [Candidatus Brocadiia bacterium]